MSISSGSLFRGCIATKSEAMETMAISCRTPTLNTCSRTHLTVRQPHGLFRSMLLLRRGSVALQSSAIEPKLSTAQEELVPYVHGPLDDLFLNIFRGKMAEEVGWDSPKPGYDGLVEIAKRLLVQYRTGEETERATVRVLRSLFPSWLLPLFKKLVSPLGDGKPAAILCAQVTLATCQWLMGKCTINEVQLPDGSKIASGVLVQKCKYLDETKCAGICIHTCKLPTQAFMNGDMGVRLTMEPNYENFSCQFNFGVDPLPADQDPALKTPCLAICPTAASRNSIRNVVSTDSQCPQKPICEAILWGRTRMANQPALVHHWLSIQQNEGQAPPHANKPFQRFEVQGRC